MNAGILPLLLLGLTLGLALSVAPRAKALRVWLAASVAAAVMVLVGSSAEQLIVLQRGLLISIVVTAGLVYLPRDWVARALMLLGINAGIWLGLVASAGQMRYIIPVALLLALVLIPTQGIGVRGAAIGVRVVASWMIAIGVLAICVTMVPTPGYEEDHME